MLLRKLQSGLGLSKGKKKQAPNRGYRPDLRNAIIESADLRTRKPRKPIVRKAPKKTAITPVNISGLRKPRASMKLNLPKSMPLTAPQTLKPKRGATVRSAIKAIPKMATELNAGSRVARGAKRAVKAIKKRPLSTKGGSLGRATRIAINKRRQRNEFK